MLKTIESIILCQSMFKCSSITSNTTTTTTAGKRRRRRRRRRRFRHYPTTTTTAAVFQCKLIVPQQCLPQGQRLMQTMQCLCAITQHILQKRKISVFTHCHMHEYNALGTITVVFKRRDSPRHPFDLLPRGRRRATCNNRLKPLTVGMLFFSMPQYQIDQHAGR
jgi:hypothetical protein